MIHFPQEVSGMVAGAKRMDDLTFERYLGLVETWGKLLVGYDDPESSAYGRDEILKVADEIENAIFMLRQKYDV